MSTLGKRLDRLSADSSHVRTIWQRADETPEAALARWQADHPGEPVSASEVVTVGWETPT